MGSSFEDRLVDEVRDWTAEGVITEGQATDILARYEGHPGQPESSREPEEGWASVLLYATAAVLLGAACLAFIVVGFDPVDASLPLFGTGLAVLAVGISAHYLLPDHQLLSDAIIAASLAPVAAAAVAEPELVIAMASIAVPVALTIWLRERPFVPALAAVAFPVAVGASSFHLADQGAQGAFLWLAFQAIYLAILLAIDRGVRERDSLAAVTVAVAALAIALTAFGFETLDLDESVSVELLVGGVSAAVLAGGALIDHRGLVTGGAISLSVVAIVFAFDVGDVFGGMAMLVALAALFIWQAERLKQVVR